MHHLYNTETQRIVWSGSGPYAVDGQLVELPANLVRLTEVIEPRPTTADGMTADPTTVIDTQAGTLTRGWPTRPKTDEEAQQTLEQLTLIERLSDSELIALEDICQPGHQARAIGLRIRAAMLAAVETYSRTAKTKLLIGAAIQLGIVADVERARELLNDPGFTVQ